MTEPFITEDGPAVPAPAADSTPQDVPIVSKPRVRPLRHIIDLLHDLAIAVVICALLITYVVQAFKVQGLSSND